MDSSSESNGLKHVTFWLYLSHVSSNTSSLTSLVQNLQKSLHGSKDNRIFHQLSTTTVTLLSSMTAANHTSLFSLCMTVLNTDLLLMPCLFCIYETNIFIEWTRGGKLTQKVQCNIY